MVDPQVDVDIPDDEDDDEPELPVAPEPKPEPTIAAPVRAASPGRGGKRVARWTTRDAEDLWPEILSRLPGLKKTPSDIDIRVSRIDPAPKVYLQTIRGNIISGGATENPRDALVRAVNQIHVSTSANGGPARYELLFCWRVGSAIYGRGEIDRPSVAEIMTLRGPPQGQYGQSPGYGYPQHYEAPPPAAAPAPQAPPAPQWSPPPFYGFGAAPQAPPGPDPRDGVISQLLDYMKRMGVAPPPTIAAPPPVAHQDAPPAWASSLMTEVAALRGMVMGGAGLGQPASNPVQTMRAKLAAKREELDSLRDMKDLNDQLTAFFSPPAQDGTVGAPPETMASPEDDLPYQLVEVAGADPTALVQRYARDKKTGDIAWKETALNNPRLAEEALKLASKVTETFGKLFKEARPQDQAAGVGQAPPPPALHGGVAPANGGGSWSDR